MTTHLPCSLVLDVGLGRLLALDWAPDGERLIVGGDLGIAALSRQGQPLWQRAARTVSKVAWSPAGTLVSSGEGYGRLVMQRADSGAVTFSELCPTNQGIEDLAWSPDGAALALALGDSGAVMLVEGASGDEQGWLTLGERWEPVSVAWSPDGRRLAAGAVRDAVRIFDCATGRELVHTALAVECPWGLDWSPDGSCLAAADIGGTVHLWDGKGEAVQRSFPTARADVRSVRWAPDGQHLLITDASAEAAGYDPSTARTQYVLSGHRDRVTQVAFSPDGRWLASVSYDGALRLWQP